jgi:hypothetical protein
MAQPSKVETAVVTFARLRRWLVAGFGLLIAAKGVFEHQWLTLLLGAVIVAYSMFAPT